MPNTISSIILAGGKSSRMGKDKARLKLDGRLIILQDIVRKLSMISEEIIVATDGRRYKELGVGVKWADDVSPGGGSLIGLYSGLRLASSEYALVVACDMPFLNVELLRYMVSLPRDYDVLVPRICGKIETMHAVYSKNCLLQIEKLLKTGHKKIIEFFSGVRVRYLTQEEIDRYDPEHNSFFNVNSPEQLEKARVIIDKTRQ
ncbi:MAG TPA: molybdenum cofactor guanylyltransferase [Dehalococcoidia bacterium]|nr:molybdenum cofactor guanylyltransferase [Dehalococcoidia bacterium]